jgi:tetratricopeptide (TPR) repeat protein
MQTGRQNEAIADYTKSLSLGSNDPQSYFLRGTCYFLLGQYDRALQDVNVAINLDPAQWMFYFTRAEVYLIQEQSDRAQSDLERAIEIKPDFGEAYFHLAHIFHVNNEREKARSYYNKAFQLQPEILTRREQVQRMLVSEEVRDYFVEEANIASKYIYGEMEEEEFGERPQVSQGQETVKIDIFDVSTDPKEVNPGEEFELRIEYMISDNTVSENSLPFSLTYRILEGDELKADSLNRYTTDRGARERRIIGLRAAQEFGIYTIEVILQYKDKIAGRSMKLKVRGP